MRGETQSRTQPRLEWCMKLLLGFLPLAFLFAACEDLHEGEHHHYYHHPYHDHVYYSGGYYDRGPYPYHRERVYVY